ncbi:GMC oxidoreductase [Trematosphaeria pertusa]|uniref:GMC oxidoreductase n=1 Tax=Trematosphaeria pertusa TaxID=390896 RepID=A0A6A6ILI6_9PLEO|nr:GMC oxidoreductase [Trematosphaeria pertusa]KAF2250928.1 GMC oxidoreductase [Trematosphaeria pertusa]
MTVDEKETMVAAEEYDFIICGGGTAGPAVAARLAEDPSLSILLIEAGKDNVDLENTQMVGGWWLNFDGPHDWNLLSAPHASTESRIQKLSRGKFLGGSSAVNGTLMVRGMRQDYEDWEAMGNPGWNAEAMWHYFNKSETFHPEPGFNTDWSSHGTSGPIHTSVHPNAPITDAVMRSFVHKGLPLVEDMFASGTTVNGCGHCTRSVWQGERMTGSEYLRDRFDPEKKWKHANLKVVFEHAVVRVLFNDDLRAVGVETLDEPAKEKKTFRCRKEVILSLGSYGSPKALLLSGIGPKEDLYEVGVQPRVDRPGVGRNLEDHLTVFVFYEAKQGTTDHLFQGPMFDKAREEWRTSRTGTLSRSHFGAFAFTRLDERLETHRLWNEELRKSLKATGRDPMGLLPNQPHVEYFTTERYAAPKHYANPPPAGKSAFANIIECFSPRSRGYVRLASKDPEENAIIHHNWLSDPLDVLVYAEACKLGAEIMLEGSGTKDLIRGPWPPGDKHTDFTTVGQWEKYVRDNATTCFHPSGTCKMGPDTDPGAVVDARLRVKGVSSLRIADCSIMPKLNNGHPQAVAYAIGEKCADMIKEDWSSMSKREAKL